MGCHAMGKIYAEGGMILGITTNTLKNHMRRICGKLDASNRMQAIWKLQQQQ
jgi:DNA-binding CsgD family transcriptional regulator